MNNDTFAGNAAPAPTTTPQSTPVQSEAPTQSIPQKPKTGLIIGIIIAILAIIIGVIVLIIVIGNNNADKGKKEDNSSANSNEGNNENNKSKKSDEKLVLGAEGETITIKNDLEATVKSFVEAGFNVEYGGTIHKIEKVYLKDKDLDDFFSSTSIPMDGAPFFYIDYEGYKLISIHGVIPNYDVDEKDAKVALSEFELSEVEVTYPGSGDYSFNGKNLNVQKSSYDDIKKAFGREADKVSEIKPTSSVQYTYTEGAFDVIITANEKEIRFLSVQPIRE